MLIQHRFRGKRFGSQVWYIAFGRVNSEKPVQVKIVRPYEKKVLAVVDQIAVTDSSGISMTFPKSDSKNYTKNEEHAT
jgi:hypothetical protein